MTMLRASSLAAILCLLHAAPNGASATMISFLGQIQTNQDSFSILNTSDAGLSITDLTIDLGDNAQFDTSVLSLTSMSDLSFAPSLETAVIEGASIAMFSFSGFDPGETFSFDVAYQNGTGATAAGPDLNNALLTVTFSNGQTLSTTFSGGPTVPPTSNRQAFMFNASATADVLVSEVPEPASAVLFLLGLATAGATCVRGRRQAV
jgi:hypothetical protein